MLMLVALADRFLWCGKNGRRDIVEAPDSVVLLVVCLVVVGMVVVVVVVLRPFYCWKILQIYHILKNTTHIRFDASAYRMKDRNTPPRRPPIVSLISRWRSLTLRRCRHCLHLDRMYTNSRHTGTQRAYAHVSIIYANQNIWHNCSVYLCFHRVHKCQVSVILGE